VAATAGDSATRYASSVVSSAESVAATAGGSERSSALSVSRFCLRMDSLLHITITPSFFFHREMLILRSNRLQRVLSRPRAAWHQVHFRLL
jgi:hypothetical protein